MAARGRKEVKQDSNEYNRFRQWKALDRKKVEEEADEALQVADVVCEPVEIIPATVDYRKKKATRRRQRHTLWVREPLNGHSQRHSDIARHVVGLKYAGEAMKEAFESAGQKFEMLPTSVEKLYYRKTDLFELAEQELMDAAMREYHRNLWICRTALSQAGPIAVQTLVDILEDEDATPSVKSKSAVAVLKMLDVDGSNNANPSEKIALESLKLVREATVKQVKPEESHIIEADDAEIIEDDDGQVGTDSEL